MRRDIRDIAGGSVLVLWGGALAIIVVLILLAMAVFGFGFFSRSTANFRGGTAQIEQTRANGAFRIAAYDRFYDQCAAIQGDEASIDELEREKRDEATSDGRKAQIAATLTVIRSARRDKIAKYNGDARKAGTIGQFRAIDLPGQLDPNEETTTCKV